MNKNYRNLSIFATSALTFSSFINPLHGMMASKSIKPYAPNYSGKEFNPRSNNKVFERIDAISSAMALPAALRAGNAQWYFDNQTLNIETKGNLTVIDMMPAGKNQDILTSKGSGIAVNSIDKVPHQSTAVLNCVSMEESHLVCHSGKLESNQHLVLANPAGIITETGSEINVARLTTLVGGEISVDVENNLVSMQQDGRYQDAVFMNKGTINITQAGLSSFVAPNMNHMGKIIAVENPATKNASVDLYGDGKIFFSTSDVDLKEAREIAKEVFGEDNTKFKDEKFTGLLCLSSTPLCTFLT